MKKRSKFVFSIVYLYIFVFINPISAYSQIKDTIYIHTVYLHTIENGKDTKKTKATEQNSYTKEGNFIRKIIYEPENYAIQKYEWYFYDKDGKKIHTEKYWGNDSLDLSIDYIYDSLNRKSKALMYSLLPSNDLVLTYSKTYEYDENGFLIKKTITHSNGKTVFKKKMKYDDKGNPVRARCKSKIARFPCKSTKQKKQHIYNNNGSITESYIHTKGLPKYSIQYSYDKDGKPAHEKYVYVKNTKMFKEFHYSDGKITEYIQYDENGEINKKVSHTYDFHYIYQTELKPKYKKE